MTGSRLRAALLVSVWVLGGCNAVLGIEERSFGGGAPVDEVTCKAYCDLVMSACTGDLAVYTTPETCLGTCALLPLGSPGDQGNTVACRMDQAKHARDTGEPLDHCPNAGPGGRGICGDDCDFYCANLPIVCEGPVTIPAELTGDECFKTCDALDLADTDDTYSVAADDSEPTRDCRILHLTNATDAVVPHCDHTIGKLGRCGP